MIRNVAVAVSGGVDSAVCSWLLKKKGYNITGVFMQNWDSTDEIGECSVLRDREDAKYVCDKVGILYHEVNFVKNYWSKVFSDLVNDYENGLTPNPDIMCNRYIKFDAFLRYCMEELGADAVATGHYARTSYGSFLEFKKSNQPLKLLRAVDTFKDQTFFLSQVSRVSLEKVMFPLGDLLKSYVKKIAAENRLHRISIKKESTGICFIGKRKFQDFIKEYVVPRPGPIILLTTGSVISEHEGLHMWTLGQCCRLPGFKNRLFIAAKDVSHNTLYVVPGTNHPALFSRIAYTSEPHWITENPIPAAQPMMCHFRFQHTKPTIPCKVLMIESGLFCLLDHPLKSITPGQYAVFYKDDQCLGSARIIKPGPSLYSLDEGVPLNYREYQHYFQETL